MRSSGAEGEARHPWLARLDPAHGAALVCAALALAPLAIGGVHLPTRVALAVLCLTGLLLTVLGQHRRPRSLHLGLGGLALSALLIWTFLQWVPLPAFLVGLISPDAARARIAAAAALGVDPPSWHPLSLDGPRTAAAFVSLLAVWAGYLTAANQRRQSERRELIPLAVIGAALAVAVVSLVQTLLGASAIYGVYQASVDLSREHFLTPFVNPNHAAGLFLLGSTCAFGVWLEARSERRAGLWLAASMVLALAVAATGSRAALLLTPVTLGIIGAIAARRFTEPSERARVVRVLVGGACLAVVILAVATPREWLHELAFLGDGDTLRDVLGGFYRQWSIGLDVALGHPIAGVGHGAFEVASPAVTPAWRDGFVSHAHNAVIEAAADWGFPVTVLVGAALSAGLVQALRGRKTHLHHIAAGAGLVAVFVQNQVDFSLLLPGVALPAAALFGWVSAPATSRGERSRRRILGARVRLPLTALATAAAALALTSYHAARQSPQALEASARAALEDAKPGRVDLEGMLIEHPDDFLLWSLGAALAHASDDGETSLRLADRAVALAPNEPSALRRRAEVAILLGRDADALPFLDHLATLGPAQRREATRVVLGHRERKDLLEGFLLLHEDNVISVCAQLTQDGHADTAIALAQWARRRYPEAAELRAQLASLLLNYQPEDTRALDDLSVELLAKGAEAEDPELATRFKRDGYLLQGFLLVRTDRLDEAWHMFEESALLIPHDAVRPRLEQGEILVRRGDAEGLERLLARVEPQLDGAAFNRASFQRLKSHLAELEGDDRQAIRELQRALLFAPSNKAIRARLARLYEKVGDSQAAMATLQGPAPKTKL
ncbi:MAG: O-antigen ligase family protein [Deltaproteobacteria bacterium]|nr:O-antigen ligase family protein [Deltaproteobacteria bacterium]MCB9785452.1 O-antigen ligase family protein [Deltaproteobacteria bacterium]